MGTVGVGTSVRPVSHALNVPGELASEDQFCM